MDAQGEPNRDDAGLTLLFPILAPLSDVRRCFHYALGGFEHILRVVTASKLCEQERVHLPAAAADDACGERS